MGDDSRTRALEPPPHSRSERIIEVIGASDLQNLKVYCEPLSRSLRCCQLRRTGRRIPQEGYVANPWGDLSEQLQPFSGKTRKIEE